MANPFIFSDSYVTRLAGNITSFSILDIEGIEIQISGLADPVELRQPSPVSQNTALQELVTCAHWDYSTEKFKDDGCGMARIANGRLPCDPCAIDNSYKYADISVCRCSHLTSFGPIYQINQASQRDKGIYVDRFRKNNWINTFGFNIVVTVISLYFFCWFGSMILDRKPVAQMRQKIIWKIKGELDDDQIIDNSSEHLSDEDLKQGKKKIGKK